jgi:hypothetical protein
VHCSQRIEWWGYLKRMGKTKSVRKIMEWNTTAERSKEFPKNSSKDEALNELQKLK